MATRLRNDSPDAPVLASAINSLKAQIGAGSHSHLDASEVLVASADATDLASALTLVNEERAVSLFHRGDTLALKAVDAATITAPAASDLASAIALANELKSDYATHIASTAVHFSADSTNTITASNASDLASLLTLVNAIKVAMNAHMADAPAGHSIRLVSA